MAKRYSVKDMLKYKQLKRRQEQLQRWGKSLDEQIDKILRQREHQREELDGIEKDLSGKFAPLEDASGLFNWSDVPDQLLSDDEKHYVTQEKKRIIFQSILQKYKAANPKEKTLPYKELHRMLREDYGIETRSVTNFFKGLLEKQELVGGTRNRAIVL